MYSWEVPITCAMNYQAEIHMASKTKGLFSQQDGIYLQHIYGSCTYVYMYNYI